MKLFPQALDLPQQRALADEIRHILRAAPLFTPLMPKTGQPFSVRMSNCGELGWVSDTNGYRYQPHHPVTGDPWPPMPAILLELWDSLTGYAAPPQACLINWYGPQARMGLHQDRDERDLAAPVLSVSLGDDARFRLGGLRRFDPTHSFVLHSGDVMSLCGETRLAFHGIDRILPDTSTLLGAAGRINLTLRRVDQA